MPKYDLAQLSPIDLEELARDLLQSEWGVTIEAFRVGRDQGIDLRYAKHSKSGRRGASAPVTIIQCKHYLGSGFDKLFRDLSKVELPKIKKLAPARYVVVTSVSLSALNKSKILKALSPFIQSEQDIYGSDDIGSLLARHENVERRHLKLWLTSSLVLERALHNAEICQTRFEVERIKRKLPLFVENRALPRALDILDREKVVVISGPPGIGKTTLAEILMFEYLANGYEPVAITGEIVEGKRLFLPDAKRIFYFDDFLGHTFLGDRPEYFGRNQDSEIIAFMEMVKTSKHSRFLLTTREHILQGARQFSERFAHSQIIDARCVLNLEDYTRGQRAKILFNHLFFSDLPPEYRNAVLENDFFLKVIAHEHFSPRQIEWLSSLHRVHSVPPAEYPAYIEKLLDNPEEIWTHAYRRQISIASRYALLVYYSLGSASAAELRLVFDGYYRHLSKKHNFPTAANDFQDALKELDGGFFRYGRYQVEFLSPSIREFISKLLLQGSESFEDLVCTAVRFKQIVNLYRLALQHGDSHLRRSVETAPSSFVEAIERLFRKTNLAKSTTSTGATVHIHVDNTYEEKVDFLFEVAAHLKDQKYLGIAIDCARYLIQKWDKHAVDQGGLLDVLEAIHGETKMDPSIKTELLNAYLLKAVLEIESASSDYVLNFLRFYRGAGVTNDEVEKELKSQVEEFQRQGALADIDSVSGLDELHALKSTLEDLANEFELSLDYELQRLDEEIAQNEMPDYGDDDRRIESRGVDTNVEMSDDDIRGMFSALREKQ